jgi:hypothetical protein
MSQSEPFLPDPIRDASVDPHDIDSTEVDADEFDGGDSEPDVLPDADPSETPDEDPATDRETAFRTPVPGERLHPEDLAE